MTVLKPTQILSLQEFLQIVHELKGIRWYRGCGDASEPLRPSLYRHSTVEDPTELLKLEWKILSRFKERSIPYLEGNQRGGRDDDLYTLFIMQHYGVPTRLLDWTESPLMALHFALSHAEETDSRDAPAQNEKELAVWILDPEAWNRVALNLDPPPGILAPFDPNLNGYFPSDEATSRQAEPVAVYPYYNNPRIVIQRGVFVIFGSSTRPMEKSYETRDYPEGSLRKLTIPRGLVATMRESLTQVGVTDSLAFPDLGGLAAELRRMFGYRVQNA